MAGAALAEALRGARAISGMLWLPPRGDPAAVMWVPLRGPRGEVVGALGGIIDLRGQALVDLIRPLALGRTGHAVIVDADGIVLAGTELHERFSRGDHPEFFAALIQAHRADVGRTPEIVEGVVREQHIMAFAPLATGAWGLGFGQAEWEVLRYQRQLWWRIVGLGALFLAVGLWVAWRDAGIITSPLRRLTLSARRIAGGDLQSPIPPEPGYEVGLLAGTLEAMRAGLQRMDEQQRVHLAIIDRRGREARALYEVSRAILSEADLAAVLATIARSARTLLQSDVSSVCLWDPEHRRLVRGAADGPAGAFHSADGPAACERFGPEGTWQPVGHCPFVRPDFRRMHVTAHLRAGDRLVGFMCVGCAAPRAFGEEEAELLTSLAGLAAIAIESAQLRERVQQLAVLEERERIGRDLHDSLIQSLYGLSLSLEHAVEVMPSAPARAAAAIARAIDTLTQLIQDVRAYVLGLHPRDGGDSLEEALALVVREFRANTLLPVELRTAAGLPRVDADQRLHLQLLVREALANVARHAGARHVTVDVARRDGGVQIVVADDGRGFDPGALPQAGGLGLRTMAERARRVGATLQIHSRPGAGTTVELVVPAPPAERGGA